MKNLIQNRLNQIPDLNERRMLRSVLNDVYSNVVDYNMDMYDRLEERIYSEISDPKEKFYIYTCIDIADNVDPIDDFLHPIIPSDMEDVVYDMMEINEKLQSGEPVVITSVFMKCSTMELKQILDSDRTYKGYVRTGIAGEPDENIYDIDVRLEPCDKYIRAIENLYRAFQNNSIEWNTVNCPYAYKFVDIVLYTPLSLDEQETIKEVSIDLAEHEKFKVPNVIPLWNVVEVAARDAEFPTPMPVIDRIIYEHSIILDDFGTQNGYLVALDNADYIYSRRKDNELVIASIDNNQASWTLLKIENEANLGQKDDSDIKQKGYSFEVLSNKRELGFAGKFSSTKSLTIRTRGEIARLLKSYNELSEQLIFRDVEILESYEQVHQTFDYNIFIDDNIRIDPYKKIMLVSFEMSATDTDDYLIYDKMSFLMSELQVLFPEYKCLGEIRS